MSNDLSEDDLFEKQLIIKGQDAETVICQYVDSILSTVNPCNPDNSNWVKPATHPCQKKFEDIPKSEWDNDYEDLVNLVERHSHCSSAYCLRQKGDDEKLSCCFNYPKDFLKATGLITVPFGGISIILVGDIVQLPPVSDRVLYHNKPLNDLETQGYCMYRKFETVIRLVWWPRSVNTFRIKKHTPESTTHFQTGNTIQ